MKYVYLLILVLLSGIVQADGYWGWPDSSAGSSKTGVTIMNFNQGTGFIADEDGCIDTIYIFLDHSGSAVNARASLYKITGSDTDLVNETPEISVNTNDSTWVPFPLDSSYSVSNNDSIMILGWADDGASKCDVWRKLVPPNRIVSQSATYDNGSNNAWEDPLTAPSTLNVIYLMYVNFVSGACVVPSSGNLVGILKNE
jgi:hypothetical protein